MGLVVAYRLPLSRVTGVTGVYARASQRGAVVENVLQLAVDYSPSDDVSIGPGLFFGLGRDSLTPRLAAGVRLVFTF